MLRPKPGKYVQFLSTPSTRRTTAIELRLSTNVTKFLSTPSARRATRTSVSAPSLKSYFYPRPPRGGRLFILAITRPILSISIPALREEGDGNMHKNEGVSSYFYPRPPRGGRRSGYTAGAADR